VLVRGTATLRARFVRPIRRYFSAFPFAFEWDFARSSTIRALVPLGVAERSAQGFLPFSGNFRGPTPVFVIAGARGTNMADPVKTDRAVHYRQMALDALRQAARSVSSRQRDLWLQLAQDWQSRALELEDRNHQPQGYDFYSALASVLMRAG